MKSNRKKFLVFTLMAVVAVAVVVLLTLCLTKQGNSNDNAKSTNDNTASSENNSSIYHAPEDHYSKNENANVFGFQRVESTDDTVTVQLSLSGEISLCRYSLSIKFDNNALELIDYDAELGVYSPVVYPGKNDDGSIIAIPEAGIINLEWASANNVSKEGDIILLTFTKNRSAVGSTSINLFVKGVNAINDDVVSDVEYNSRSIAIDLR